MKRSAWNGVYLPVLAGAMLAAMASGLRAEDASLPQDQLSLKIAKALSPDRFYMRAGAVYVKVKTKSGETYDVTGPVATKDELQNVFTGPQSRYEGNIRFVAPSYPTVTSAQLFNLLTSASGLKSTSFGIPLITAKMDALGITEIGTPPGLTGEASSSVSTAGLSLGYFLGDEHTWAVEGYVLAVPPSTSVMIKGNTVRLNDDPNGSGGFIASPILIDGQEIVKTKLLPPIVQVGRYWGGVDSRIRPYTGLMAMYAIFFDTKATDTLNNYVGGSSPGDTTVSFKNAFGLGPVLGVRMNLNDKWHANFSVGHVKLRTEVTITTRNSTFAWDRNLVLQDLGELSEPIATGESVYNVGGTYCGPTSSIGRKAQCEFVTLNGGVASLVMKGIAADRGKANMGTYVRKADATLTNTIFQLGIGRSF